MSWIKKVTDAHKGINDVPLIEFIRKLSGETNEINPIFYNLIQVDRSEPLMENAFLRNPNAYLITGTKPPSRTMPFIELNLGENQIFRPRRIFKMDLKSREGDNDLNKDYI